MFKRFVLSMLVSLALLSALAVNAQESFDVQAIVGAGVSNGDLYALTPSQSINVTQDGQGNFQHIAWHGDVLAYSRLDEAGVQNLWVSLDGQPPFMLVTDLAPMYPFSFTVDGLLLYAGETHDAADSTFLTDVYTIAPETDAEPQLIGQLDSTIAVIGGCGGGSPLPTDWQRWTETGFGGRHITLAMTPYGIVYTLDCVGGRTGLLNLETGEMTQLGENFGNVALSPDRAHLVGTVFTPSEPELGTHLATADLATGEVRTHETFAAPDQITWAATGDVVFYTEYEARTEGVPMTDEEQEAISQYFGAPDGGFVGFPLYANSIHRYDLSTGADTVVYTAPETVASIGRIFAVDGSLIFSQIPNLQVWIAAIAAGELDPFSAEDTTAQQLATVPVSVFTLDLESGDLTQVGEDINRFTPKA